LKLTSSCSAEFNAWSCFSTHPILINDVYS
jgi:hypothetical protein